jgi:hypothetical protein
MKTIKVFLASSEELKADRNRFGNLIRKLSDKYEDRGIRIKLFEWEDYDAAYNGMKKQEEYNVQIKDCDIFIALFQTIVGKYTMEEVDYAIKEFKERGVPKIGVYFKSVDTQKDGDEMTLKSYLQSFDLVYGSYNDFEELSTKFKGLLLKNDIIASLQ